MRITSLEVKNLLSFASFEMQFQRGLNVIVGPNGAGKSNVLRVVALVRTALDIASGVPHAAIEVRRHLRIGATQQGKVSLGVELTEEAEWQLVVSFVRALVASSMERNPAESSSADGAVEQLVAARVRQAVGREQVESLLRGRLVLWLDAGPPDTISFAYEFDHEGTAYHYGIMGGGIPPNWVALGSTAPSRRSSWTGWSLNLSEFLSAAGSAGFTFGNLLPAADQLAPWDLKTHPSGQRLLLSEELARTLAADPDPQRAISFGFVLYRAIRDRLVLTENLRRPPRTVYDLSEVSAAPALDDAGDLPLELYRRKVGQRPEDRSAFQAIQKLFRELTGDDFDVTAEVSSAPSTEQASFIPQLTSSAEYPVSVVFQRVSSPPAHELHIEAVVPVGDGQVAVQLAGAGVWETLVASAFAVPVPGRVLLLDEPAVNLHPSWQRLLLTHLASLPQVVLITHSPYLVPGNSVENLRRITRLRPTPMGTACTDLRDAAIPEEWLHRWRQDLARSADARAALFARGIVLLEGDTDYGAFGAWFSSDTVVRSRDNTCDARNLALIVAGSDKNFGVWVSYLRAFGIPWAILCDGPVLSPEREVSLLQQLTQAGVNAGQTPTEDALFAEWKKFWEGNGVFTVADRFGGVKDEGDREGEIEAFFGRMDPGRWQAVYQRSAKSKVRAGYAFAEEIDLVTYPQQLRDLQRLWEAIVGRLTA